MDFILGRGPKNSTTFSQSDFGITSYNANVPLEMTTLDALVEMEIFAKINFIKQGKLLSLILQIKI